MAERPFVLSVAGIDPSAGAGLLADIKTLEQLMVYGLGIPTANTIQTAEDFYSNQWLPSSSILEGVKRMMNAYPVRVVKFGIIENVGLLEDICGWIKSVFPETYIIWDPVMKSSTSFDFQDQWFLSAGMLKNIDVVTPNAAEWKIMEITPSDYPKLVFILKGGHNEKRKGYDLLIIGDKKTEIAPQTALPVSEKHGSGCIYSSALAAHIAKGEELEEACRKAKNYTEEFLASNSKLLGYHYGTTALHIAG